MFATVRQDLTLKAALLTCSIAAWDPFPVPFPRTGMHTVKAATVTAALYELFRRLLLVAHCISIQNCISKALLDGTTLGIAVLLVQVCLIRIRSIHL